MGVTGALILSAFAAAQTDPVALAQKDLGSGFHVEAVEPGILLARPAGEGDSGALRDSIRSTVRTFRARALDVPPRNALLIVVFATAEGYRAYTAQRYPGPVPQSSFYDVPNRRVLLRGETADAYARQVARMFLLTDSLNGGTLPPWLAAALSVLEDPDPEPATFDHRAALLQQALRQGSLPALRTFFGMDLETFHAREALSQNTSLSLKFAEFLEKRGALPRFFQEYRRTFRSDDSGATAAEAALGGRLDGIEKDFQAYLGKLPWLNSERFQAQARKVFGPSPLILVDEGLLLAVTGNVEQRVAVEAVDQLRRIRDPLIRLFGLRASGLPVLARLFSTQEAFQDYAKVDAPHRQWLGGYFSFDSRWLVLHLEPDEGGLTHEYCHSLFEDDLGRLPPWLTEGLACLFQRFRLEGGLPVGEPGSSLSAVRTALAQNRVRPLSEFLNLRGAAFFNPEDVNLNYDLSHALLFYLQERRALVPMYKEIQRVKRSSPLAPPVATSRAALETALGTRADAAGEEFRSWVLSRKP